MDTLFATTAQCAATIIAIIGGFIVTKLISLLSEKKSIQIELDEIAEYKAYRNEKIDAINEDFLEDEALDFISKHITSYLVLLAKERKTKKRDSKIEQ